jgi:hypothetical protein
VVGGGLALIAIGALVYFSGSKTAAAAGNPNPTAPLPSLSTSNNGNATAPLPSLSQ